MIGAYLSALVTAVVSAFLPVVPVEPYLVGVAAATACSPVGLGVVAAAGQTLGKTVLFLGARGALRSARVRSWVDAAMRLKARRIERRAEVRAAARKAAVEADARSLVLRAGAVRSRVAAVLGPVRVAAARLPALVDRPALTAPILLLSAVVGLPPLFVTSIYAGGTRIGVPLFVVVCFAGRALRFIGIAYAPHLVLSQF